MRYLCTLLCVVFLGLSGCVQGQRPIHLVPAQENDLERLQEWRKVRVNVAVAIPSESALTYPKDRFFLARPLVDVNRLMPLLFNIGVRDWQNTQPVEIPGKMIPCLQCAT